MSDLPMYVERIIKVYGAKVKEMPDELRKLLNPADRRFIHSGGDYLASLARKARHGWLRKILQNSAAASWHIEFAAANQSPMVPYYRFDWGGGPALCLPRWKKLRRGLPPVLQHFYSIIGGLRENEYGYAGGVYRMNALSPLASFGVWIDSKNQIDPKVAVPFLETLSGDSLCYLPGGKGAWYKHEMGRLEAVKSLDKEIARYFDALLAGSRL